MLRSQHQEHQISWLRKLNCTFLLQFYCSFFMPLINMSGSSGSDTISEPRIDPLIARDSEVTAAINAHVAASDPHTQYFSKSGRVAISADAQAPSLSVGSGNGSLHSNASDGTILLKGGNSSSRSLMEIHSPNGSIKLVIQVLDDGRTQISSLSNSPLVLQVAGGPLGIGTLSPPTHPLQMGSGAHVTTQGSWVSVSDENLKTNIAPIEYGLDTILQLRPVTFTFKSSPSKSEIGFIAQEVAPLIPEAVSAADDHLCIAYGSLSAPIIRSIQQLAHRIDRLEEALNFSNSD